MSVLLIKDKDFFDIRTYYLRDHISLACSSIDVVVNTTDYDDDLLFKMFEMLPVKGNSNDGWININGPHVVTSNDIVTKNITVKDEILFSVKRGQTIHVRLNYTKGKPSDHIRWRQVNKIVKVNDGVKVFMNI